MKTAKVFKKNNKGRRTPHSSFIEILIETGNYHTMFGEESQAIPNLYKLMRLIAHMPTSR